MRTVEEVLVKVEHPSHHLKSVSFRDDLSDDIAAAMVVSERSFCPVHREYGLPPPDNGIGEEIRESKDKEHERKEVGLVLRLASIPDGEDVD